MKERLIVILNDNKYLVSDIKEKLKENGGYCPCKLVKNEDTKCMCKEFREQQKPGECHCGLYKKVLLIDIRDDKSV